MRPDLWNTTPTVSTASRTYRVVGVDDALTADTVATGLASVHGVQRVRFDVEGGRVTIDSAAPLDRALVEAVVAQLGFRLGDDPGAARVDE